LPDVDPPAAATLADARRADITRRLPGPKVVGESTVLLRHSKLKHLDGVAECSHCPSMTYHGRPVQCTRWACLRGLREDGESAAGDVVFVEDKTLSCLANFAFHLSTDLCHLPIPPEHVSYQSIILPVALYHPPFSSRPRCSVSGVNRWYASGNQFLQNLFASFGGNSDISSGCMASAHGHPL